MNIDNLFLRISELGLNKKKVSVATGISTGNLSDWQSGRSMPSAVKLDLLADYLDCSVDYLLGRTDTIKKAAESDEQIQQLCNIYDNLNDDGKSKLIEQAVIMEKSGLYSNNQVIKIAARTGHTTSTVPDNIDDYPDIPDTI